MQVLLCLSMTLILVAFIQNELRSAWFGIRLSNGFDVLVSPEMYRKIVQRYRLSDEPDAWDRAVLNAIRVERPNEWRFLVRSRGRRGR
jgi:hypothetical protein